jgi:hypothetical protein
MSNLAVAGRRAIKPRSACHLYVRELAPPDFPERHNEARTEGQTDEETW